MLGFWFPLCSLSNCNSCKQNWLGEKDESEESERLAPSKRDREKDWVRVYTG
jgi:hypothetical protein